jgi:hypothetical protein
MFITAEDIRRWMWYFINDYEHCLDRDKLACHLGVVIAEFAAGWIIIFAAIAMFRLMKSIYNINIKRIIINLVRCYDTFKNNVCCFIYSRYLRMRLADKFYTKKYKLKNTIDCGSFIPSSERVVLENNYGGIGCVCKADSQARSVAKHLDLTATQYAVGRPIRLDGVDGIDEIVMINLFYYLFNDTYPSKNDWESHLIKNNMVFEPHVILFFNKYNVNIMSVFVDHAVFGKNLSDYSVEGIYNYYSALRPNMQPCVLRPIVG